MRTTRPADRMSGRAFAAILCALVLLPSGATSAHAATADALPALLLPFAGSRPSAQLDANGKLHVAYLRSAGGVGYATNASGTWTTKTLTTAAVSHGPILRLDQDGHSFVVYATPTPTARIRQWTDRTGTWVGTWVTATKPQEIEVAFALDRFGASYLAYSFAGGGVHYLTNRRGWFIDQQLTPMEDETTPAIEVDTDGRVFILSHSYRGVRLRTDASGAWTSAMVTTTRSGSSTLAVRSRVARVVWSQPDGLFHRAWTKGTLGAVQKLGPLWRAAIALDGAGKVHLLAVVTQSGVPTDGLAYLTDASGAWIRRDIGPGSSPSIMLRGASPTFVFGDPTVSAERIYQATTAASGWTVGSLPGGAATQPQIALGAGNQPHVVSVGPSTNPGIFYRTLVNGTWTTRRLTSSAKDTTPRIALDPFGKVHIAWRRSTGYRATEVRYATNADGGWVETVALASPSHTGPCAIAVDSGGQAHILLLRTLVTGYDKLSELAHSSSGWSLAGDLPATEPAAGSFAVGTSGTWHATYMDNGFIAYAKRSPGGAWTKITQWGTYLPLWPQIAVDVRGKVHVAYLWQDPWDGSNDVRYRTDASGAWVETVLATNVASASPGIAIDAGGAVHVAYATRAVHLASKRGGAWVTWRLTGYDVYPRERRLLIALAAGSAGEARLVIQRPTSLGYLAN